METKEGETKVHLVDLINAGWIFGESGLKRGDYMSIGDGEAERIYSINYEEKKVVTLSDARHLRNATLMTERKMEKTSESNIEYLAFKDSKVIERDLYIHYFPFLHVDETFTDGAGI